jgi:sugar lactone lactonase YvrE
VRAGIPEPAALAFGPDGSLYIADGRSHVVRKMDPRGTMSTFVGRKWPRGDAWGYSGDGGPAAKARIRNPAGLAFGPDGCLYIADSGNHRIRRVDRHGIISTVVGSGPGGHEGGGFAGDGGPAGEARLRSPKHIAFDRDGNLYIADAGNGRVRKVCGLAPPEGVREGEA